MSTARNQALTSWMDEHGYSSNTFAEAVNEAIGEITGRMGGIDGAQVRDWKAGRVRWPKEATRRGLEAVTGLTATDLGFVPRERARSTQAPQEDPLLRRTFVTSTALAASSMAGSRIGMTDIARYERKLSDLVRADDRGGGTRGTESAALRYTAEILDRQQTSSASQRVRSRMYFMAAAFASTAMWAAIDARNNARSQQHLEKAVTLASLSADPRIQHRVWGHASMLAVQQKRYADAVAAGEVARNLSISRRDPLFGSLAQARLAGAYSWSGKRTEALRAMASAERSFERAEDDGGRPAWMNFFDHAELQGLSALIDLELGRYERAEYRLHQTLTLMRPELQRNRAYYTYKLAYAQLGQGELELACATTASASDVSPQVAASGRVKKLMRNFGKQLLTVAPDAAATREWLESHLQRGQA